MKESHLRSLIKAASWRILGTCGTMVIAFILTHKMSISFYIGLSELVTKIGLFYLHERIWNKVSFGTSTNKLHKEVLSPMSKEHA